MSKPQTICLVHTGGTLGMTGENELEPGNYAAALIEQMPEYLGFANIDSLPLFNLDSADMGPKQWSELAQCISDRRPNYDGFIVIHGTDTMPYTAAALAFALEGLDKPVILPIPLKSLPSIFQKLPSALMAPCSEVVAQAKSTREPIMPSTPRAVSLWPDLALTLHWANTFEGQTPPFVVAQIFRPMSLPST